jgi:hypothetical protein
MEMKSLLLYKGTALKNRKPPPRELRDNDPRGRIVKRISLFGYPVPWKGLVAVGIVLVSLVPAYRLASIALTVGENNLSNDYLAFTQTIVPMMNGGFSLSDGARTCFRGQCEPLTMYIIALMARLSHWNVRLEIAFSIVATLFSALTIYCLIADCQFHIKRLWILTFIAALPFSFTLVSTYTFGQAAVYTTLGLLGLCVGLLGVTRFSNTYKGIALLVLGAGISVWSYGAGLLSIPILFVGLVMQFRKRRFYAVWTAALLILSIPYIQLVLLNAANSPTQIELISLFRPDWIVQLIGLFFSNGFGLLPFSTHDILFKSNPLLFGYLGLGSLVLSVVLTLRYYGVRNMRFLLPELGLVSYGLGAAWIISAIRSGIVPWYVSSVTPFWIGLTGIYYSLLQCKPGAGVSTPPAVKALAVAFFAMITVLFIHSNVQYEDKLFHIQSRAPVSASCLRNYRTAPTYCEQYLYQWEPGHPEDIFTLGATLEKYQLSVFAPSQEWSLQGDYLLESVQIVPSGEGERPHWVDDAGQAASWKDYHRLSLALPVASAIEWELAVPGNLSHAELSTEVAIAPFGPMDRAAQPKAALDISIAPAGNNEGEVMRSALRLDAGQDGWMAVEIPLDAYKGQNVKVTIASAAISGETPGVVVLRYPRVDLDLKGVLTSPPDNYNPQNSANIEVPLSVVHVFPLDPNEAIDASQVTYANLSLDPSGKSLSSELKTVGQITFQNNGNFCISNDSQFYMRMTADQNSSGSPSRHYTTIDFDYFTADVRSASSRVILPMLRDGKTHTYTYPMKLLADLSGLSMLRITPMANHAEIGYTIHEIGFYTYGAMPGPCVELRLFDAPQKEPAGEIVGQYTVSQSFVAECDGLSQVQLLFGTYFKTNAHPIIVRIAEINDNGRKLILRKTIRPGVLDDNSWHSTRFPSLASSRGRNYQIDIFSPKSVPGDAVTVWQVNADVYPFGTAYVNGVPIARDLAFGYLCVP